MLAYVLAIIIAIGSFSFYMAAFFVPEMHRRQDFIWSGLGMFYAVVLWFCAGRITGAVLLGQIASVVLLSWLGWHTLELRRDLTPEPVRTPVTWEDLRRWTQKLQRQLRQYLRLGSVWTSAKAVWADVRGTIAEVRNRTAGPRGIEAGVPPLQRSPAYEFETEAGEGESVPSEFATVSTRAREEAKQRDRAETAATTPEAETAATSGTAETPETTAAPQPAAPPFVEAELIEEPAEAEVQSLGRGPAQPTPTAKAVSNQTAKKTTTPTGRTPAASQPARKTNPVAGAASWLGEVIRGFRKPKPQRGIVEIPPRPPSIPRADVGANQPTKAQPPQSNQKSKPQRGVIDIPPRPPSIPRSPKPGADQPNAKASPPRETAEDSNWVDVGDASTNTANWPPSNGPDASVAASTSNAPEPPPPAPEPPVETNWPEDDDTNWPEDDDTNWPD